MTNFTKGEWVIASGDKHSKEICITTGPRNVKKKAPICEMDIYYSGSLGTEQLANAHLIAAAPKMYRMLEMILKDARGYEERSGINVTWADECEKLLLEVRGEND